MWLRGSVSWGAEMGPLGLGRAQTVAVEHRSRGKGIDTVTKGSNVMEKRMLTTTRWVGELSGETSVTMARRRLPLRRLGPVHGLAGSVHAASTPQHCSSVWPYKRRHAAGSRQPTRPANRATATARNG